MQKAMTYFLSTVLLSLSASAIAIDDKVLDFEKQRLKANKQIEVQDIQLSFKKELPQKEWYGFLFDIDANFKGKQVKFKDIVFSNGEYIALDLIHIDTHESIKKDVMPKLTNAYYKKENLLLGNPEAKDTIVVFSDPLCPFCMDFIPDVIRHVQKHKNSIALYYYHFPLLQLHPASGVLTRLMDVAIEQGNKDIVLKVYEADWDKYFTEQETNEIKILEAFNKELNTHITLEQIQTKKINEKILDDIQMGENALVQGTPTIFVNGEKDSNKTKFLELGK
ncbi:DsbA family protein [Candidatus Marinarcus aquaticus]|nr:thioredoxin domain-containing protein [Candidatus Marinarcus aquaticus]